ncbi:MAG: hypothetical protein ACR2N0_12760 [Rubrobacteraceae bacterium]
MNGSMLGEFGSREPLAPYPALPHPASLVSGLGSRGEANTVFGK